MKGICFKESLFNSVVKEQKTQTRRLIDKEDKFIIDCGFDGEMQYVNLYDKITGDFVKEAEERYKVGETIYLKEPYALNIQSSKNITADKFERNAKILYRYAGHAIPEPLFRWKNKLFMPAKYARYFIEITSVRCERIQDISEEDCLKEGILKTINYSSNREYGWEEGQRDYYTTQQAYTALIDKINGKGTWESNAWVWVYDFKLVNKTFDEILDENKDILKRLKNK